MHVVIFEGSRWQTFAPLALSRPLFMLATGSSTLLDKQIRHLRPTRLSLWVRPEMVEFIRQRVIPRLDLPATVNQPLDDEPALIASGRTLHLSRFIPPDGNAAIVDESGAICLAWTRAPGLSPTDVLHRTDAWMKLSDLPRLTQQPRLVNALWDLISWNEESLVEDSMWYSEEASARSLTHPVQAGKYYMVNEEQIWIQPDVKLSPGCVLDAGRGPIVIGQRASIGANSVIEGPCFIGPMATIQPLTHIRPATTIGAMSKVGGEISNSLILGHTNKGHYGFLGNSYVGKWANLGAGTTTSNMKNTYGEINTRRGPEVIPTGRRFLGALIGDHCKTAVNTKFPAGAYVGFGSMVATDKTPPQFVPSYTFLTNDGQQTYHLDKSIEVARRAFSRRDRPWNTTDEGVMRYVHATAPSIEG